MNKSIIKSVLLTAPLLQSMSAAAQQKQDKPNVVFVLVDDLRWDAMGFTGQYEFLKTPNIDQLRKEGVHFQNTFCNASLSALSGLRIVKIYSNKIEHEYLGLDELPEKIEFNF
jgi:hypothetical protein